MTVPNLYDITTCIKFFGGDISNDFTCNKKSLSDPVVEKNVKDIKAWISICRIWTDSVGVIPVLH